jgi:beta-N-acetylhexosaminidase
VIGTLPQLDRPLLIECRPPGGMASGELPWSLAEPLRRLMPGTEAHQVHAADAPIVATLRPDTPQNAPQRGHEQAAQRGGAQETPQRGHEAEPGRDVVLVVRDPVRHTWQLELLDLATVVVDVGWPVDLATGKPVVRTRGVAPGLLEAAAEVLAR